MLCMLLNKDRHKLFEYSAVQYNTTYHVSHWDNPFVAVRSNASRLDDIEGPFCQIGVAFRPCTETFHFFESSTIVVEFDLFFPSQGKDQWRKAFVAEI
jgi:hypothetical protein